MRQSRSGIIYYMKRIELTRGKYALIDNEQYDLISLFRWCYVPACRGYAVVKLYICGKQYQIYMHRLVMNAIEGVSVDHIDGNGLNNQKSNLRICTHQENIMNQKKQENRASIYKGVSFHGQNKNWYAYIKINQKKKHIGCYDTEEEAAEAYNKEAVKLFGRFANLNVIDEPPAGFGSDEANSLIIDKFGEQFEGARIEVNTED